MKLTYDQFDAAVYIFEKNNGNFKTAYEEKIIFESGLSELHPKELEKIIIEGLNSNFYKGTKIRTSAYWALSKRSNSELIPNFTKWMRMEFEKRNTGALFQLMIALDNLEEPIFHTDRNSYSIDEIELNIRDADKYLNQ